MEFEALVSHPGAKNATIYGFRYCIFLRKMANKDDMPTVAEQLRQAREARNLTVSQVAEVTKMRTDHIRALEEGDYNVFSAPVYIRGFVRTYSTFLKLEVREVMASLDSELGGTKNFSEPPALTDESNGALDFLTLQLSKLSVKKVLSLLVLFGVVALIISGVSSLRSGHKSDPLAKLPPGVYKPVHSNIGETLPLPVAQPRRP